MSWCNLCLLLRLFGASRLICMNASRHLSYDRRGGLHFRGPFFYSSKKKNLSYDRCLWEIISCSVFKISMLSFTVFSTTWRFISHTQLILWSSLFIAKSSPLYFSLLVLTLLSTLRSRAWSWVRHIYWLLETPFLLPCQSLLRSCLHLLFCLLLSLLPSYHLALQAWAVVLMVDVVPVVMAKGMVGDAMANPTLFVCIVIIATIVSTVVGKFLAKSMQFRTLPWLM